MEQVFLMDGVPYNVRVLSLQRKFAVVETGISGRTQNGMMYRDLFGTYYHYTMTVAPKGDDSNALDAFWEAVSRPRTSHVCVFPYGQHFLTQRMYVTAGEQPLERVEADKNHWGAMEIRFIALAPEVIP